MAACFYWQFSTRLLIAAMTALFCPMLALAQSPAVKLARPTPEQAAWQDLELGVFIHYDMPVFKPGWNHRQYETRPDASIFNPKKLDTDQWMQAAKGMGAKYAVFVAKHGSGFMCWQSDLYPYGMKQSPCKNGQGDIVRDFVNSCRKYDIQPGLYCHMGCNGYLEVDNPGLVNRGKGGDAAKQARYAKICEGMLNELWGNYGPLTEIWFDGGVLDPAKGGPDMLSILRKLQPKAIVLQGPAASIRWIGNEDGVAPYPCWATVPDVRDYSGPGTPDGTKWLPGECDVPVRNGIWMWEPNTEGRLFTVDQLMDKYYRSVGRNCNLLLNANPDQDGLIPEPDVKRYKEFGDEIRRRFGKSIAETNGRGELVELDFAKPTGIDHVITMENILEGERVREYVIEGLVGGQWKELCRGTSIGRKKIDQFSPTEVSKIRWRCLKSVAEPRIRKLAAYSVAAVAENKQATAADVEEGFTSLFNGKDLNGWEGKPGWWRVEDGAITGESTPEKPCPTSHYLIYRGAKPADFDLRVEFKLTGCNSGIQFRSRELPDFDAAGYQADMCMIGFWYGCLFSTDAGGFVALRGQKVEYDESGKKSVTSLGDSAELLKHVKQGDWNEYRIVAKGNEITLWINGVLMSQTTNRQEANATRGGIIALQMHPGPPMKVQFKNIRIKCY